MTYKYIEIIQPIGNFYICGVPSEDLVDRVESKRKSSDSDGVQRDIQNSRIKSIAEYCSDPDAIFPTPIVISVSDESGVQVDSEKEVIIIPDDGSIIGDVIDGQHRLWGIKESDYSSAFILPVVFVFNLTVEEKAYIFSTINSNQVKVDPSLIYDLFDVSKMRSPFKTAHEIARAFNSSLDSPFYNRLKMLGKKQPDQENAILSQGTFVKGILQLFSKNPQEDARAIKRGEELKSDSKLPLRHYFIKENDKIIYKILLNCFSALREVFWNEWDHPKDNILWKTTGFGAIIYSLPSLCRNGFYNKDLTKDYFIQAFLLFRDELLNRGIYLNKDFFSGGGVQLQKSLARIIINSIRNKNLLYSDSFHEKSDNYIDFYHRIYPLDKEEFRDLKDILNVDKKYCGEITDSFRARYDHEAGNINLLHVLTDAEIDLPVSETAKFISYIRNSNSDFREYDQVQV